MKHLSTRNVCRVLPLLAFACVLGASTAKASPDYPAALSEAAGMQCVPQCTVCHTVNPGVSGTAKQPFAIAMIGHSLLPGNADLVGVAFNNLKNDSAPQYQAMVSALEKNFDPNYDESLGQLACGPTYGCGAHVAKSPPRDFGALAWALGALALFGVARRVKPRR
ncbi:MAG: hypothetical protein ACOY0T_02525 [Myxococcota bacterium]